MVLTSEPLSRVLISNKICSQRNAKIFIRQNEITVNEKKISDGTVLVVPGKDKIAVNGVQLKLCPHIYLMLNKSARVVCSKCSDSHKTVFDILVEYAHEKNSTLKNKISDFEIQNLKCVGRLDSDTTGLLLLSTNGSFVNFLTRPENNVRKTYCVVLKYPVSKIMQNEYSRKIKAGIFVPQEKKSLGFVTKSADLKWISDLSCEITVTEGHFHEVRRIFCALENPVQKLKRISIGSLSLDPKLKEGEARFLTEDEIKNLV